MLCVVYTIIMLVIFKGGGAANFHGMSKKASELVNFMTAIQEEHCFMLGRASE